MKRILLMLLTVVIAAPASAVVYDQNVTPDLFYGSGNDNGSFTVDIQGGIELGLRGKLRFDPSNQPQNIFNSNGDGTYSFIAGAAPGGFSWMPGSLTTPVWNFDFTVNVDIASGGTSKLGDYTYEMGLDFDPSPAAENYLVFDPITPNATVTFYDHAIGDNFGTDLTAGDAATYATYLSTYNVAQQSWNYEFFNDGPYSVFDPADDGVYEIYLKAFDGTGAQVAHTNITIVIGGAVANEAASWGAVKSLFR